MYPIYTVYTYKYKKYIHMHINIYIIKKKHSNIYPYVPIYPPNIHNICKYASNIGEYNPILGIIRYFRCV